MIEPYLMMVFFCQICLFNTYSVELSLRKNIQCIQRLFAILTRPLINRVRNLPTFYYYIFQFVVTTITYSTVDSFTITCY